MSSPLVIGASRIAALVGDFDRSPAYVGLAEALALMVDDGRVPAGARLPSERELTAALGVSRTTVTRAYAALGESGHAEARRGSGTFTRVPADRARAHDRALTPRPHDPDSPDLLDLGCAAHPAPPLLAAAYADAAARLPAYLGGTGYFPTGLPDLQSALAADYERRGLPTDPAQIMVTSGALAAVALVARVLGGRGRPALVETPTYPNAAGAIRAAGSRLITTPVDPSGFDLHAAAAVLRRHRPDLAYLVPDFHNPTGLLMTDAEREEYAVHLRAAGTVAVVDEAHHALVLDDPPGLLPRPFAAHAPDAFSVGSASKAFWGGLRLGWIRVPADRMHDLVRSRVTADLGAPVLEQLALVRLLEQQDQVLTAHRARLREQRDALVGAVATHLPEWHCRTPGGGLALWCELPAARATALCAEAERRGVVLTPGPVFAVEGGLDRFVRIPWVRPVDVLTDAVRRVAEAWSVVRDTSPGHARTRGERVMVA